MALTRLGRPGNVAVRGVEIAMGFIGITEQGGNNRGEQIDKFIKASEGGLGDPWCAYFIAYCLKKAILQLRGDSTVTFEEVDALDTPPKGITPFSGYTPDYKQWGISNGLWIPASEGLDPDVDTNEAEPGDLALFYFPKMGRIAHIGIVEQVIGDTVYTIEGNTRYEAGLSRESASGGDGVWRKKRDIDEIHIRGGFVRLPGNVYPVGKQSGMGKPPGGAA